MILRFLTAILAIGWPTSPTLYQLSGPPRSGFNPFALRTSATPAPTPVLVQQATGFVDPGDTFTPITFSAQTIAGTAIIVCLSHPATTTVNAVLDSDAVNFTQVALRTGSGVTTEIWALPNGLGGTAGVFIDSSGTVGEIWANLTEWSGLNNAGAEATNTNSGLASSTVTTNSVTPASTRNLVIAVGGWTANDYVSGPTNSFTRMTPIGGTGTFQESAYLIQSSATARSTGWTLSAGINWAAAIAVFGGP